MLMDSQIHLDQRKGVAVGGAQGAESKGRSLRFLPSILIAHHIKTRATRNVKQDGQRESLARHSHHGVSLKLIPSREYQFHRLDDTKAQDNHSFP
jgi:hypothetical protein